MQTTVPTCSNTRPNFKMWPWVFLVILVSPALGLTFPVPEIPFAPRQYHCQQVVTPPIIDGILNDPSWSTATWSNHFTDIEGDSKPAPTHLTKMQMVWDDEFLYVGALLLDPHVWGTLKKRDSVIYHDNDFEIFIDPDGDNHQYYELEINALGTEWDLRLVRPYRDGGPAVDTWDIEGLQTAISVLGTLNNPHDTDVGWSVEMAIPWPALAEFTASPCPPRTGDIWRINFSRVQWQTDIIDGRYQKRTDPQTGKSLPENNWVWSPQGLIAMHYPEMWGEVMFTRADGRGDFATNPQHAGIIDAQKLMPIYYAQKQFLEDHDRFADSLDELPPTDAAWPIGLELIQQDHGFVLKMTTTNGSFSLDETGRLLRFPLAEQEK